ncbi:MAG: diguanylate cyclase [Sulfuriflexus sp.]|nr:diguanylate cyclase [Sulfuriflexus sp.]
MNKYNLTTENGFSKKIYQNSRLSIGKLLVTDKDFITTPVKDYLVCSHGIEVHVATHSVDIPVYLSNEKFDVILLDLSMPGIDLIEIIDLIKSHNDKSKVILAYDEKTFKMAMDVMCKGSFELLKKPYDVYGLIDVFRETDSINKKEEESIVEYKEEFPDEIKVQKVQPDIYKFMIQNSQDVIYTTDSNGVFTFINSRAECLLGFSESELIGKHYSVLVYHEDIEDANKQFYEQIEPGCESKSYELRLKCKLGDGGPILFDIRSIPFPYLIENNGIYVVDVTTKSILGTYCMARDITERKRVEDVINHSAHHDFLTGLPDKLLINDRIDAAIAQSRRSKKIFAVLFLDLDGFKDVNDTYGHSMGDALLQAVSARIRSCVREIDTLARVGGDEFMLLVSQIDERSGVHKIAEKIIHEIEKPYTLMGSEMTLSASIGVAMYPDDGETKDELVSNADMAMYHVKRSNKKNPPLYQEI